MATREENLKKINDELEKLSDEELEKVAGGGGENIDKFFDDYQFVFNSHLDGPFVDFGKKLYSMFPYQTRIDTLKSRWKKYDITLVVDDNDEYKYYLYGKEISREQACKRVNFLREQKNYS